MNLTLRQVSYFIAVAEAGTVSGAAAALGISQSAITEAVKALEERTGSALFKRHARGVSLTSHGHRFLRHAHRILATVADAEHALTTRPEGLAGSLNLGVTSLVSGYFLAELLARFRRVFPDVAVRVVEEERPYVEHLMVNGELDLAVMLVSNLEDRAALEAEVVVRSRNRVWMAPDHPLMKDEAVTLQALAAEPLITLTIDEMAQTTRAYWRRAALQPNVVLRTASVEAVRSLVATGAGVAVMPDMAYRPWSLEGARVEARHVADPLPTIDVGLAWRRGSPMTETARTFLSLLGESGRRR
ncbi:MAG TPA: LysR family transcriptional regulator [Alphaproteobacteria bacterium]|nr:LysR family transcriptional regulator [Alphaproteobacteria bacterium]